MKVSIILFITLLFSFVGNSQNDTLNQIDENGKKQGHWIYYGKDRPEAGYPANGKIEEGPYKDNRKEGIWIKYHNDGVTPKIKGKYHNNRPSGNYWKYDAEGNELEAGNFDRTQYIHDWDRGRVWVKDTNDYHRERVFVINDTVPKLLVNEVQDTTVRGEQAPVIHLPITKRRTFDPNGYNKIYNKNDEVWQDGEFRNYRLWNGKVYDYDSDGILLKVRIFKKGVYHSDGQL